MPKHQLHLFTDPGLLTRLGHQLLGHLFSRFSHLFPPTVPLPLARPDNDAYFVALAEKLSSEDLPDTLVQALEEIEALASPANVPALNIPGNVDPQDPQSIPLFHAIHRWLALHPLPSPISNPPSDPPLPSAISPLPPPIGPLASDPSAPCPRPSIGNLPSAICNLPSPEPRVLHLRLSVLFYEIEPSVRGEFFQRFEPALRQSFPDLPEPSLEPDDDFDKAVYRLLKQPAFLPQPMLDALLAIEEMAAPQNRQLLRHLVSRYAIYSGSPSPDQIALELWLKFPFTSQDIPALLANLPPPPAPPAPKPGPNGANGNDANEPVFEPVAHPEPQKSETAPRPAPGDLAAIARFPRHKISKLPPEVRETINRALRQRVPYDQILAQPHPAGAGLNKNNLTRWKKTGYLIWLAEQERREEAQVQAQLLFDLLHQEDNAKIHEATQQIAALRISQVLAACNTATLTQTIQQHPQLFVRLAQTLPALSRGGTDCERLLLELAERKASLHPDEKPKKRILSDEALQYITQKMKLM
jgi:hypothetical protein